MKRIRKEKDTEAIVQLGRWLFGVNKHQWSSCQIPTSDTGWNFTLLHLFDPNSQCTTDVMKYNHKAAGCSIWNIFSPGGIRICSHIFIDLICHSATSKIRLTFRSALVEHATLPVRFQPATFVACHTALSLQPVFCLPLHFQTVQ